MISLDELGAKLTAGRQPGQELSPLARAAITGAVAAGASQSAVARAFGINRKAVQRTLQRFESSGTFEDKPRSGRPEVLTEREKRHIVQVAKREPGLTTLRLTNTVAAQVSRSTFYTNEVLIRSIFAVEPCYQKSTA
ncbi:hypothetical protein C7999DRAFT_40367 [Corynascus novoguineensis]|uniref:Transposase n=1 Tax=Corynascus novoguineensis TaxID=1126955 RepID=A0AAN7HQF5_9PEZI|nr:hypothetical protein C7999DRAFT_40367 [Corynascus novoguineensis]